MTSKISLSALISPASVADLYAAGLNVATRVGLPVTSWRTGDPTTAEFEHLAEAINTREQMTVGYIRGGFLSLAADYARETGDAAWLKIVASEMYGVDAIEATYATPSVTVKNNGGGLYVVDPGDVTFKCTLSDKTYHNTSGGTLSAGVTLTFTLVADEPGSGSTVSANQIDQLVTTMIGVAVLSSTAAIGLDEESPTSLEERCNATLGGLSPNGPGDAFEYVARNPDLTGTVEVTRAKANGASGTGDVNLFIAGPSSTVSSGAKAAVLAAILKYATPLCITPFVNDATLVPMNVTATINGDNIPADFSTRCQTALNALYAATEGGGRISISDLETTIQTTLVAAGASRLSVNVTAPASDTVFANYQVPVPGATAVTEV